MRIFITNSEDISQRFQKYLISACDIIMLNACIAAFHYGFFFAVDFLLGLLAFNCLAIIGLRQWLSFSLQIPWLYSPFNRAIKRIFDILAASVFILTLLPVIYIIQSICIKKKHSEATLRLCRIDWGTGKSFNAIIFKENEFCDKLHLGLAPIAFNIISGQISIWDINSIKEVTNLTDHKMPLNLESGNMPSPPTQDETNNEPQLFISEANPAQMTQPEIQDQAYIVNQTTEDEHI